MTALEAMKMKKRAIEAAVLLGVMIALFIGINILTGGIEDTSVTIDGNLYNTGVSELRLTLMTEEGLDRLDSFTRLDSLKIIPYKYALYNAQKEEHIRSAEKLSQPVNYSELKKLENEINTVYSDCTDIDDLFFLKGISVRQLDISYCRCSDISPLTEVKGLTALNISHTQVSDISPLAGIDSLKELIAADNVIDDLSPLMEIDSLELVKLSDKTDADFANALREKGIAVELISSDNGEERDGEASS